MSGQIFLESAELSSSETGGTILVAIVRAGDLSEPVTITYGITGDTAEAGVDFVDSSGTITMEAGQSRVLVPIEILDDLLEESTEAFVLSLISADSGSLLAPRTARVDILDNESPITDPPQPGLISTHEFTETEIATGLDLPISVVFSQTNPDLVYIAEKGGVIKTLNTATGETGVFMDISDQVNNNSDRGILNIVLHPDFEANPYVYVYYVADPADGVGAAGADLPGNRYAYLSRFEADATTGYQTVIPDSEVVLVGGAGQSANDISGDGLLRFDIPENVDEPGSDYDELTGEAVQDFIKVDSTSHAGGGLAFGPDGALYLGVGDGVAFNFVDPRAVSVQDINSLSGKILRIDPITGEGMADNPFVTDDLGENASKVFQLGLRNPFRLAFDDNGRIIISDTGWNAYEELNSGDAGANFGWPFYEGGDGGVIIETEQYNELPEAAAFYASVADGSIVIAPAFRAFAHDSSAPGYQVQAITGGSNVFTGTEYTTDFSNHYFFADFSGNEIYAVNVNDRRDITFIGKTDGLRGPVDFVQGTDGKLYYIDIVSGRLVRIDDIIDVGGATVIATPAREILSGSAGADEYIFSPGTSTTTFLDVINSWEPQDRIDLTAFNITEDDLDVRLLGNGDIIKLLLDNGPDDFQLKINLNGFTVEQVLASIVYDSDAPTGNRAPIAINDNLAIDVDTQGLIVATANDFDPDGDAFVIQSFTQTSTGSVALDEFGAFIFTPDPEFIGTDSFTYTIVDPDGITSTATVTLTVSDPNSVNTIFATTSFEVLKGTEGLDRFVFTEGTSTTTTTDVLDDWQPGDIIDLSTLGLTLDDLEVRLISGGETLKLIQGFDADDFQLKIDLNGFSEADILASIDFGGGDPVNTAPTATDDSAATVGVAPVIIDALINDTDPEDDLLTISAVDEPLNGTVTQLPDGTFEYVANEGFVGTDTFTYSITDGEFTSTATVSVDVSEDTLPVNRIDATENRETHVGTEAIDQFIFESGDSTASQIDTIIDWQPGDIIDLSALGFEPDGLEVRLIGGGNTLKLIDGFSGDDFQLRIELNGHSAADVLASIDYGIGDFNRAPNALADAVSTDEETSVSINVLLNDSDPEDDPLEILSFSQGNAGTVSHDGNGVFTYAPLAGTSGIDSFSYVVSDGQGNQSTATVSVTVGELPVNIINATNAQETLVGTDQADSFVFNLGTSVRGSVDTVASWSIGDSIDLSALGLSLADLTIKTISSGTVLKLNEGFNVGDFQLRIDLNEFSAQQVIDSIIFDAQPPQQEAAPKAAVSEEIAPDLVAKLLGDFVSHKTSGPIAEVQPVEQAFDFSSLEDGTSNIDALSRFLIDQPSFELQIDLSPVPLYSEPQDTFGAQMDWISDADLDLFGW